MTTKLELRQFAVYPYGRYRSQGPYSGEEFRESWLIPALHNKEEVIEIVLDGARGLGSSFLEEAFGGLVRRGFTSDELLRRFKIISVTDFSFIDEIVGYIKSAKPHSSAAE